MWYCACYSTQFCGNVVVYYVYIYWFVNDIIFANSLAHGHSILKGIDGMYLCVSSISERLIIRLVILLWIKINFSLVVFRHK